MITRSKGGGEKNKSGNLDSGAVAHGRERKSSGRDDQPDGPTCRAGSRRMDDRLACALGRDELRSQASSPRCQPDSGDEESNRDGSPVTLRPSSLGSVRERVNPNLPHFRL
jgi:hypothetical protein